MNTVIDNIWPDGRPDFKVGNLFRADSGQIYMLVLVCGAWATVSLKDGEYYKVSGIKKDAVKGLTFLGDVVITVSRQA